MPEIKEAPSPANTEKKPTKPEAVKATAEKTTEEKMSEKLVAVPDKPYEEMTVDELQAAILEKMRKSGTVINDYILGTVKENTHHGSLVNWAKSFN